MVTYKTYVVKAGDTLSLIARDVVGKISDWRRIAEANAIQAPYTIRPGQSILIPVDSPLTIPITRGVALDVPRPALNIGLIVLAVVAGLILLGTRRNAR